MAYVPNDPDQQNQGQQGGQPAIQPPITTSSAPGAGPAGMGGAGASAQPTNQNPGQPFTNLSAYLTANQPQIAQMAQGIAGGLTDQYGQIQNQIQGGVQDFNQQVQSGYNPYNPDLINQATSNPVDFVSDPNNVSAFQGQLNNVYGGPSNFETSGGYGNLNQAVTEATNKANLLKSPGGFQSYLRQGGNNTTAGQDLLDSVLLQGSPEALQTIQSAASPYDSLMGYLSGQTTQANQGVTAAQQAAQQSTQQARSQLEGAETGYTSGLQDRLTGAQTDYQSQNQRLNDLLQLLGVPVTQLGGQSYFANTIDPRLNNAVVGIGGYNTWNPAESIGVPVASSYLTPFDVPNAPTMGDIATQDDVALGNALSMLSGGQFSSPVTAAGNYQQFQQPTIDQARLGGDLWSILENMQTPTYTDAINPNAALTQYKYALGNLRDYLGIAPLPEPESPEPPPSLPVPEGTPPPPPPPPPPPNVTGPGIIRPYGI